MLDRAIEAYRAALIWWVDTARRVALAILIAATAGAAAASYYTLQNLGINTDTEAMLSPDLPFRRVWDEFGAAFPQLRNLLLVVIEGDNPDLTEDAAALLASRLKARPDLYHTVYHPGGDRFFQENGLLFLEVEELVELADELAAAQPLLATLARDPSLRGLVSVLVDILEGIADGTTEVKDVDLVFDGVGETIEAQVAGRHHFLSWKKLMRGGEVSREERRRFIVLQPRLDYSRFQPGAPAIDFLRRTTAALDLDEAHGVRVRLTGSVALSHEEIRSVSESGGLAGLLSLLFVAALLVVGLRSARLVLATLVALVYGLIWTTTFATAAVGHLNLMSVAFAVLFVGLGVDFGIHFGLRYREEIERGKDNAEALRLAAGGVGDALTLCAVMAAIGFYAFMPTAYTGVSELGLIAGTGMFVALFASLTVMPAVLTVLPLRPRGGRAAGGHAARRIEPALDRHARKIVLGAVLLGAMGAVLAVHTRFDFNPLNLRDPTTESVQTLRDLFAESDAVPYTIGILAQDLDKAVLLAERLEQLAEVDRTITLRDYVPGDQDEKLEIIEEASLFLTPILTGGAAAEAPDKDQRRAELDRLVEALGAFATTSAAADHPGPGRLAAALAAFKGKFSVDDAALAELERRLVATLGKRMEILGQSLKAQAVTADDLPDELMARQLAADGRARIEVYPAEDIADNAALRGFVMAVRSLAPNATDSPVIMLDAGDAVVGALKKAMGLAVVLISVALLAALRNPLDAALVLLPLALAGVLTLAATVLFDMPFNFANAIVLPLLLGLGVASGIHLVMRDRGEGAGASMLLTSTPRAVLFSALTTIGSFGTLAVSSHRGTASMGQLLTISIALTLVCTLVVLPAMLSLMRKRRRRMVDAGAELTARKSPLSAE
jgi:hopanoid biosynthesis associated RND transporter like protein HpnN